MKNIQVIILYALILHHSQILKFCSKKLKFGPFYLSNTFMCSFENLPNVFSHNTLFDQSEHVLVYPIEQCIQCFGITKSQFIFSSGPLFFWFQDSCLVSIFFKGHRMFPTFQNCIPGIAVNGFEESTDAWFPVVVVWAIQQRGSVYKSTFHVHNSRMKLP